jgi:hypothetical protein
MQLVIGFACLAIGVVLQSIICVACFCIVKFARDIAQGRQDRPNNAVGAALYDVSAKYGNYIPGGTALGVPANQHNSVPVAPPVDDYSKPLKAPGGYNGSPTYDTGGYGAGYGPATGVQVAPCPNMSGQAYGQQQFGQQQYGQQQYGQPQYGQLQQGPLPTYGNPQSPVNYGPSTAYAAPPQYGSPPPPPPPGPPGYAPTGYPGIGA